MSLFNCGACVQSPISAPPDTKQEQTSFDIVNDKVAVRGIEITDNVNVAYNVLTMEPDPKQYELLTVIGKGCFQCAFVHLARHIPSDTLVAVKRIQMDECKVEFSMIQNELTMHKILRHPNLLPCLDSSFVFNNELWTVFPLMGYGSCRDLLHAHFGEGLPELAIAYILQDVIAALDYLHQKGLIHRALKASHVLVSSSGQVVLSGFHHVFPMNIDGKRSKAVHDFPNHFESCLNWASPELLEQNLAGYDTKSDIYGLGILACELANGVVPFADMPATQMLLEKMEGTTPRLLDSNTVPELSMIEPDMETSTTAADSGLEASGIPYQRTFSPQFHNFVEQCLQTDPGLRPAASVLLQHSFFRQVRRKSGVDLLPELLKPVSPLTALDLNSLPKEEPAMDEMIKDIEDVTIDNNGDGVDAWSF